MNTAQKNIPRLLFALLFVSGYAVADGVTKEGYLLDVRGNVVKNSYNQCWHTGSWTPAKAIAECDPDLVKKEAPPMVTREVPQLPPVVPMQAPEPKTAPVATPPKQKITLSADSLFDFDKADLRPKGKKELDELAQKLNGISYDFIMVTGHASRTGTATYNMKLSVKRAESVKAYLVSTGGIEASKIKTEGKGETEPVTKPGECKGNKATKKLIACLQPDRRVEVEVSGMK
jgi:OOP family OmpA-OmpF porin